MNYVALLRGVNVGKGVRVPMKTLKGLLEDLGLCDVVTYLNSGKQVPLGAYVYVLKLKGLDGLDYKYSGTVTLLK